MRNGLVWFEAVLPPDGRRRPPSSSSFGRRQPDSAPVPPPLSLLFRRRLCPVPFCPAPAASVCPGLGKVHLRLLPSAPSTTAPAAGASGNLGPPLHVNSSSSNHVKRPSWKLYDYVRYDLKEIAFPSSLPDPPGIKKRPKLTLKDKWCILKEATRLYAVSWVRDIGPELRPNDYKKAKEESDSSKSEEGKTTSEPTVLEDLAVAARGGAETLKPALRRIYMTRASTYTSAVKNYVETYQEGLKDVLEEKAAGKGHQQGHEPTKSPPPSSPPSSSS